MSTKAMRRRCAKLVDMLDIPVPFDVHVLCARVAAARGRSIELRAIPMPAGGPCGVWVSVAGRDFIFYERHTSGLHQEHIVLHEIGHFLGDHEAGTVLDPDISQLLMPDLDPAVVDRVLQRTHYSADNEREAETIASLILERANRWRPASEWAAPPEAEGMRRRIGSSLEPPTEHG
jgi:hypothetical protein